MNRKKLWNTVWKEIIRAMDGEDSPDLWIYIWGARLADSNHDTVRVR